MEPDVGKKVLVVEDDEDIVQLVSFLLETEGYEVSTAANGQEALDSVAGCRPDLILLDMKMPVMGGAEFAREYRARHSDLAPIVVVTAADDAQRRAADIDADGWIAKPFDPGMLLDTVRRYAGGGTCAPVSPP
jgi:CheY-like chemotaxis protein